MSALYKGGTCVRKLERVFDSAGCAEERGRSVLGGVFVPFIAVPVIKHSDVVI